MAGQRLSWCWAVWAGCCVPRLGADYLCWVHFRSCTPSLGHASTRALGQTLRQPWVPSHHPTSFAPWVAETPLLAACPQMSFPGGSQLHATALQPAAVTQRGTLEARSPGHPWQPKEPLLQPSAWPVLLECCHQPGTGVCSSRAHPQGILHLPCPGAGECPRPSLVSATKVVYSRWWRRRDTAVMLPKPHNLRY